MIQIVIGVILFIIGGLSFLAAQSSADGGTVWTGGMLVGAGLVFWGVQSIRARRKSLDFVASNTMITAESSAEDVAIAGMLAQPTLADMNLLRLIQGWTKTDQRKAMLDELRKTGRLA